MRSEFRSVAQLRELLQGMERDLGLEDLSRNERDLLYAVQSICGRGSEIARSDEIRSHQLMADVSQPTFHRALRSLVDKGFLAHAPETKVGAYKLTWGAQSA